MEHYALIVVGRDLELSDKEEEEIKNNWITLLESPSFNDMGFSKNGYSPNPDIRMCGNCNRFIVFTENMIGKQSGLCLASQMFPTIPQRLRGCIMFTKYKGKPRVLPLKYFLV